MESLRSLLERGRGSSLADIRVLRDCPRLWGMGLTRSAIVISIVQVCLTPRLLLAERPKREKNWALGVWARLNHCFGRITGKKSSEVVFDIFDCYAAPLISSTK